MSRRRRNGPYLRYICLLLCETEEVIAAHRAAGGRIVVTTHMPIEIAAAGRLVLDDFAPTDEDAAAG